MLRWSLMLCGWAFCAVADTSCDYLLTRGGQALLAVPANQAAAARIVYVHGYRSSHQQAFDEHRILESLTTKVGCVALLMPAAPSGPGQSVLPVSFEQWLEYFPRATRSAPLVVAGHSGAYRTLRSFLQSPMLESLVMLDAAYGDLKPFTDWLCAWRDRRLLMVTHSTTAKAHRWHASLPPACSAQASVTHTARGHMAIVTDGVELPLLVLQILVHHSG